MRIGVSGYGLSRLGGTDWNSQFNVSVREYLKKYVSGIVERSNDKEIITFVISMAKGFEQFMAAVVIELRDVYPGRIKFEAAIPYLEQWVEQGPTEHIYKSMLEKVNRLYFVDSIPNYSHEECTPGTYSKRSLLNCSDYVVDTCDILLVMHNGYTQDTTLDMIEKAKAKSKDVLLIDPNTI